MALANGNSFAIDPNELQSDEQIDHDINHAARPDNILDPGFNLTLRPMKYRILICIKMLLKYLDCRRDRFL